MSKSPILVDLILHATAGDLSGIAGNHANRGQPEQAGKALDLSIAISRAISPGAVAEDWMASGDIARDGERLAGIVVASHSTRVPSVGHTRAIEIAVARRLADTACALTITGDAEDTAHAVALWRAAEAITGMHAAPGTAHFHEADRLAAWKIYDTLRGILGGANVDEVIANARKAKDFAIAAIPTVTHEATFTLADLVEELALVQTSLRRTVKALMTERDAAKADADRRLQIILAKDKTDDAIREALGACDGEDSLAAAKRTAKARDDHYENVLRLTGEIKDARAERDALKGRDPCKTCRSERRVAVAQAVEAQQKYEHANMVCVHVRKERDAAVEARAQMQARLVAVERERDAAQEESKALRMKHADKSDKPKPGDRVAGKNSKDGSLYFREGRPCKFRAVHGGTSEIIYGPDDEDFAALMAGGYDGTPVVDIDEGDDGILIACDLGDNIEEWHRAMRDWFTLARA